MKINVKYPCRNCIYFKVCGEKSRVEPCHGRLTEKEKKNIEKDIKFVESYKEYIENPTFEFKEE